MFSIDKNEPVLENVAKTVKYECFRRGFDYKEDEIKFLALQEISCIYGQFEGSHSNLEPELNRLMDICINFLCTPESMFSVKNVIVQSHFLQCYRTREDVEENYRQLIKTHTNPLIVDICRSEPRDDNEYQNLYRKIVLAMLLLSGVGDATKKEYIAAAEAALKSIFPVRNVDGFIRLSFANKLKELDDMKNTITGIIMFNEFKYNQFITSNPQSTLLNEGSKIILDKLSGLASSLDIIIPNLTYSLQEFIGFDEDNEEILVIKSSPLVETNDLHLIRTYLLLVQQCSRFIRILLDDARHCHQEFLHKDDDFHYYVKSLVTNLRGKSAVAMTKVYTKFKDLGVIWTRLQELCVIFNSIHDEQNAIMALSEAHKMPDCVKRLIGCQGSEALDVQELASQISLHFEENFFNPTLIDPLKVVQAEIVELGEDLHNERLEFNGFCPVYCVETGGFLMDARREIGVIKFEDKLYGFRDSQAAHIFGKDPKLYIERVIEFARSNVEYIETLCLTNEVIKYRGINTCKEGVCIKIRKPTRNKEMQTEIHPIESYIEKDYSWNMWEYKRRAVQLANIVNCSTKSTQSYESHFRETSFAQLYSPREKPSQTKRDTGICTDDLPAESWTIRGRTPHIRLLTAECLPGQKQHKEYDNEYCNP